MNLRLPPQPNECIDRARSIAFRFEGTDYRGFAGDMISTALWANGVRMLGRSFKYHRPRGIYSLAGHDANVIVQDAHQTNLRGCMVPVEEGMELHAVNTFGGLARDRLRITDRFGKLMPVGFYYKAFHTPRRLFPFYERQIRQIAGLGSVRSEVVSRLSPNAFAFCELLVVGSGPAGLSAAVTAAEQGVEVLLVEEQPQLGGSLLWQRAQQPQATKQLQELRERVNSLQNVQIRCGTQAAGCYADSWVALVDRHCLTKVRSRVIVAAAGCFEQPAVFQNNDLPGVMLGSAAQRLVHQYAVKPFDRCVVVTANADGYRVAIDLLHAGVQVAAVADLRSNGESSELIDSLRDAKIPLYEGAAVHEAVAGRGKSRIVAARLGKLDRNGRLAADDKWLVECDGIAMSVGWAPNIGLAYQAGGRFSYSEDIGQFVPETLPEHVFVAGRARGIYRLEDQLADGHRAGLAAARQLGRYDGPPPDAPLPVGSSPSHSYAVFAHANKKNFVDLDEDLHLADFVNAHHEGYDNIELLKRYTTVGMGPSQGKLSNMNAVRILARLNGRTINETGTTTSRPFHQPVPLGQLAGRRLSPIRRTPLHSWHVAAGAKMVHAGDWLRPEYYAVDGRSREACILHEAVNVRERVGLIDLGTLGKIEVSGPDAVKYLERIYTGRFAKQAVGQIRYGVACDELGVVIEDGVIARLGEDRFYVSTTSSGAAAFYRELQRWALIFDMNVVLANVTGQRTAMNLAGSRSRAVLASLTDTDISPESFPYLGALESTVAEVPVILMRVGFVGELGYEIHVPATSGMHVWKTLMRAGKAEGIEPFGVEAQRLLRLEKGHLIVGQDTDALTNPYEAELGWSVRAKKPFFVGGRSLAIARERPLQRRLVGFTISARHTGPLPEECHLIIENDEIVGRVTSIAHRSTIGHPLGLAFVRPDLAEPGTKITIRVDDGSVVEGAVKKIPFYDPDGERQECL